MIDFVEQTFLVFINEDPMFELYQVLTFDKCTIHHLVLVYHLLNVFFCDVCGKISLRCDSDEILGASLLMDTE